jgi:DNA topoisomerase-1
VILDRGYAVKRGQALVPTFLAMVLTNLMEQHLTKLLDYEFTARLEDDLDAISRGEADTQEYLTRFYFGQDEHTGLKPLIAKGETDIDPRIVCGYPVGADTAGNKVEVRIGKYGPFISNGTSRASLPNGVAPDELSIDRAGEILRTADEGPRSLGVDPATQKQVYIKIGRFGPYVQLGENDTEEKPKMVSLLPTQTPDTITLEQAQQMLEFPKTLGTFQDNEAEIIFSLGRYGPYVTAGKETRSLPADVSPLSFTFEQAVELLRAPKQFRRRGAAAANGQPAASPARELGVHPDTAKRILVKSGRFGPYVTDGEVNATIPKSESPEGIALVTAIGLLNERRAKLASGEAPTKKRRGSGGKRRAAG